MVVFKYIEDKDVFQKFYSKMLAKRLVQHMSASDDAEASMISKLKQACGFEYTSKLQRMFQDIGVSKDLNDQFKKHVNNSADSLDIDFSIQVSIWIFISLQSLNSFCHLRFFRRAHGLSNNRLTFRYRPSLNVPSNGSLLSTVVNTVDVNFTGFIKCRKVN